MPTLKQRLALCRSSAQSLSVRVAKLKAQRKVTQVQIAEALDLTPQQVNKVLNGHMRDPDLWAERIQKIRDYISEVT